MTKLPADFPFTTPSQPSRPTRRTGRRARPTCAGLIYRCASHLPVLSVVLPAALPQIMTGLQVALPLSLIVAVVTEMLMGGYGLGGAMMTASRFANSVGVFAGIVEIAVVGYVLVKAIALIRRRLLIWHQEANEPTTA